VTASNRHSLAGAIDELILPDAVLILALGYGLERFFVRLAHPLLLVAAALRHEL
jgi:hypothetical protein